MYKIKYVSELINIKILLILLINPITIKIKYKYN